MCYTKSNLIEPVIDDLKENYESIAVLKQTVTLGQKVIILFG